MYGEGEEKDICDQCGRFTPLDAEGGLCYWSAYPGAVYRNDLACNGFKPKVIYGLDTGSGESKSVTSKIKL